MQTMTWTQTKKVLLVFLFLLAGSPAATQTPADTVESLSGVEVVTSVDRAEMLIGDLVTYTLAINYDSTCELVPPPLGANLGVFDVKDYHPDIITNFPDGRRRSENRFILSTFTTGEYVIPPIPIMFILPDSSRKVILSESVPITVKSLLESEGDSLDIRGLKDPYEFKRNLTKYYLWGGLALAVLCVVGVLLWRWFMRRKDKESPVDQRPAWEIAFEKLAILKEKSLIESNDYKQYYIELTEIAREYLGRMHNVDVMEMTTAEFLVAFQDIHLPYDLYQTCEQFLTHADLVKFARFIPERLRAESDLEVVHDVVEKERVEYKRRRQEGLVMSSVSAGSNGEIATGEKVLVGSDGMIDNSRKITKENGSVTGEH